MQTKDYNQLKDSLHTVGIAHGQQTELLRQNFALIRKFLLKWSKKCLFKSTNGK